jgi:hypothetical protein
LLLVSEVIEMQNMMACQWARVEASGLTDINPKGAKSVDAELTSYLLVAGRRDTLLRLLKLNITGDHGSKGVANRRGALQNQSALATLKRNKDTLLA